MKPCNYISESIVLITPVTGDPFKAKLVTEYGRNASGGLIVVSTRYVDEANIVLTVPVDADISVYRYGGEVVAAQDNCRITTEMPICVGGVGRRMVTEYGFDSAGGLIVVSTRYVDAGNNVLAVPVGTTLLYGECEIAEEPLTAPGALLSANICVGSPVYVPQGNRADTRTVGTGGSYATYAAAMADATVVDGTILRSVSDVVDTATVNVNRAVVIDFNGFTHSNATSVTQFNVTAALAVIKDGVVHQTKTTNTSLETAILINTATGPAFVVDNTIKVQEFGVVVQGSAMIVGNKFEYAGASQTNSHRFIALYKITAETKIDDNEFTCSTIPATTRYSNFVFMSAVAGSTWTAPLWVTRNRQTGGSLRQFVFNEALVPVAGSQLIVAANSFNDFNGGVGLLSPALYNGLDKIVIVDNDQGGDAAGNFKGVFFVDGTGTLDDDTELVYGGNTTAAGALRADYLSLASDTDNIVAHRNTITPPAEPAAERGIQEALEDTGLLLQDLKGRRTYLVDSEGEPLAGYGTEDAPYVLPESTGLWSAQTGTLTNTDKSQPVYVESNDSVNGTVASLSLDPATGVVTLYGSDKVSLNSGGEYEFIGVPEDTDESATKALVYNPTTYKVEYKDLLAITGDRYKTVSSTCNDIVSTGNVTFTVEPGLAYTPQQDIIALASVGNSMTGEVVSYNDITGELVMSVQHKEGSGNFCNWVMNLDAVKIAAVSVYYGNGDPVSAGQVGVEGDLWYVTSNTAAPSEQNVTEHWVYDWSLGWKRVWKKEYMFEIQRTDSFDATYYYYGGDVGPDWQVHRYNHVNPADPLYMIPEIAELSNNPGVTDLASAFAARATLNYA